VPPFSYGVAVCPSDATDAAALIACASVYLLWPRQTGGLHRAIGPMPDLQAAIAAMP
jgi:hypothetical protein